ncbi:MAG: 2-amino-4-hydroxy-6-hydroxymethyldihydropteridine diphosphokinase [candidate division KSB1 bacterium]|nr:2-amino-4-hydroxy-6-hydroxymethyldihydropteridine diphosphokinase [candidate division KSB1 bacterium]
MEVVFLSLGSNLGDRLGYLRRAVGLLEGVEGCRVRRTSSVYETEPLGPKDQGPFLNAVVEIEAEGQDPYRLLYACQGIEDRLGRQRQSRWGPRTVDLDILCFGQRVIASERLTIPHPELQRRRFVLVPWAEIAPDHPVPVLGKTVAELLHECPDQAWVIPFADRSALHSPQGKGDGVH